MSTFWKLCDLADDYARKHARTDLDFHRQLLATTTIGFDAAHAKLAGRSGTAESTIEAIKQAVKERGRAALKEPETKARLDACDEPAKVVLHKWIKKRKGPDGCAPSEPGSGLFAHEPHSNRK
ncbi:MAG: hypothetical protein ACXU8R_13255 [Xanthobacteraceae bacterium]